MIRLSELCLLGLAIFIGVSSISGELLAQGVTIGSAQPPDPAAVLDLQSNQGGFLLPRLTQTQRDALVSPPVGLQVFNTTSQCIEAWFLSGWKALACECTTPPPMPGGISGPLTVCPSSTGQVFSITPVSGAASYSWSISGVDTLVSGQGSSSITVNFSNLHGPRTISVMAQNGCGTSAVQTLQVNVVRPDSSFTSLPASGLVSQPVQFSPAQAGLTYAWIFQGGTPASSSLANPSVTWTSTGTYTVTLQVSDALGCTNSSTKNINVTNCQPLNMTFTNCTATGSSGPSQSQCNAQYGAGVVTVSGGIQTYTIPLPGTYRITVKGARGGGSNGANGAIVEGDYTFSGGEQIQILVGQMGGTYSVSGSGGGGTFVVLNGQPLFVAGGGGGDGNSSYTGCRSDGWTMNRGRNAYNNCNNNGETWSDYGYVQGMWGGAPGLGGANGTRGGGGGGFTGNGNANYVYGSSVGFGYSFTNGGAGGVGSLSSGGFGGGGGTFVDGGGGGGGYSGGGGASNGGGGGGGGSYISPAASNVATSDGKYEGSSFFNGAPIQNLNQTNNTLGSVSIVRTCP